MSNASEYNASDIRPDLAASSASTLPDGILLLHAVMLFIAFSMVFFGTIFAGIISPILTMCKIRRFREGYAHSSHNLTIVLSIVTVALLLAVVIYNCIVWHKNLSPRSFFFTIWQLVNYWRWKNRFQMDTALFIYTYTTLITGTAMAVLLGLFAVAQKTLPARTTLASERHAFVICTHNSSAVLEYTLRALLKLVRPHQIYVGDNGSSQEEERLTDLLCGLLSAEFSASNSDSKINVFHIPYGNKTLAQYTTVFDIYNKHLRGISPIDLVTILDDDVIVPDCWPSETIEKEFYDKTKVALGYPLSAANRDESLTATFQDIEYLSGNVGRYFYNRLGSQLFASGAISTWRVEVLIKVLDRHCTVFDGEDLEMGYIVHKLSGRKGHKLGMNHPIRIGFIMNCIIPTIVPYCSIHWYDVLPNPLRTKMRITACKCGEKSFFTQRLRSWDAAGHNFFQNVQNRVLSWGFSYSPKWFARLLAFIRVINLIQEYFQFCGFIWTIARLRTTYQAVNHLIFFADSICVSWGLGILYLFVQSLFLLGRIDQSPRPDIAIWYIILMGMPYTLIVKNIGIVYSLGYYVFFQRFPEDIRRQLQKDATKNRILKRDWVENEC